MKYLILLALPDADTSESANWVSPSEVNIAFHDTADSLDAAIKAERFYRNMFGLQTKREALS